MKRILNYIIPVFFILAAGCEDIYEPEIDVIENVLVVDARISADADTSYVHLYKSVTFYQATIGEAIEDAVVTIIDSNGEEYELVNKLAGYYRLVMNIDANLQYKLKIEHKGDTYESFFEAVPKNPALDTVYGVEEIQIRKQGGDNNVDNFEEVHGVQLYADISPNSSVPYYRFTSRFVLQYTYPVEVIGETGMPVTETMYCWGSVYPTGSFNIASPPEYTSTKEIKRHPLFFLPNSKTYSLTHSFAGWIIILYQHGLTEQGHGYYDDLNKQLDADGKIFDPMYVQARSNIKCTTDEEKIILGNFEISASTETRYFLRYISEESGFVLRPITEFYDISEFGEQLIEVPEFWQKTNLDYR
ncbi:MAG TPA: DUF4249 domain-containing protein [Draconibacterium sp.]|nr:DUF4249 domain-containing protein [Draconibacterium sp.]